MSGLRDRVAGAPISWGVCEVAGWGHQLAPERVLREMSEIGIRATELGPDEYLPSDPARLRALLDPYGLELVSGFVPLVLHRAERLSEELATAVRSADLLAALGCKVLVLCAATGESGYERSAELDVEEWASLARGIDRVVEVATERGLTVALHPHYGTVVEGPADVESVLEVSAVPLCIDTGHLLVGGADPVEVTRAAAGRVAHVHLKDVSADLAERVRKGSLGYHEAVRTRMYRPLGDGDAEIATIVRTLEGHGYRGWYVLEQDAVLASVPEEGAGPIHDARRSLEFLDRIADQIGTGISA